MINYGMIVTLNTPNRGYNRLIKELLSPQKVAFCLYDNI
jgi:hypothetical protein